VNVVTKKDCVCEHGVQLNHVCGECRPELVLNVDNLCRALAKVEPRQGDVARCHFCAAVIYNEQSNDPHRLHASDCAWAAAVKRLAALEAMR